jgi:hypothetical protein
MSGIEALLRNVQAATERGQRVNADERAEEELLSTMLGLRFFTVPADPTSYRILLDPGTKPTPTEQEATVIVLGLLARFKAECAAKCAVLLHAPELDAEVKTQVLSALVTMTTVQDGLETLLRIVADQEDLSALVPKEIVDAAGLVTTAGAPAPSA